MKTTPNYIRGVEIRKLLIEGKVISPHSARLKFRNSKKRFIEMVLSYKELDALLECIANLKWNVGLRKEKG